VVCLAGLLLRLFRLTHQSFWNDEILTIDNAGGSLLEVLAGTRDHNILPLYYVAVRGLLTSTPAELWLRLPSVLFGTLSIPVFYVILRRWGGSALGLTGAALMAFAPFHVWYSQEARPYALLILLSLVALHLLQLAIDHPTPGRKAAAAISAAATFYCHTIALGFLLFLAVYVLLLVPRHRWKEWLLSAAGTALLLAPGLLRLFVVPPVGSADVYKPVTVWSLGYMAWAFGTGYSLGPSPTQVLRDPPLEVVTASLAEIGVIGGFLGALLIGGVLRLRRQATLLRAALAWMALPCAFALAGALGTVHPLNVRYAMLAFPAFQLLLAVGLLGVPAGGRRLSTGLFLAGICFWSLRNYFFEPTYRRDDNQSAGAYLTDQARAGDLVVATAGYTAQNLRYYYAGPALDVAAYPGDDGRPEPVEGPGFAPVVVGARYVVPDAVPGDLVELTAGHDRVWLFMSRTYHSDPDGLIARWLDRRLCRETSRRWEGVELRLYARPTAGRDCPAWER
jgi:4-amino-4-deoxy-L-arabinose transferase-like glycosyltransferase